MRKLAIRHGPWSVAAAAWLATIGTTVAYDFPCPLHGLADTATLALTGWAFWHHGRGPRLQPGERITTTSEDELAARMDAQERRSDAQDEAWRAWRKTQGGHGLELIRGEKGA